MIRNYCMDRDTAYEYELHLVSSATFSVCIQVGGDPSRRDAIHFTQDTSSGPALRESAPLGIETEIEGRKGWLHTFGIGNW